MIIDKFCRGPTKVPGFYDRNSKRVVGMLYRPPVWQPDTVYYFANGTVSNVVIPTVFNGLYYAVVNPGKSLATEPVWPLTVDAEIVAGPTWRAIAYDLLPPDVDILTSSFTATNGVTITQETFTTTSTQALITSVPEGIEAFEVTNHTIRSNGEEEDVTLFYRVGDN